METAHELFLHGLNDMLDAEQKFLQITGELAEEVSRPDLKKQFETHRQQTEKQIERLQQCFVELGQEPEGTECAGVRGLLEEHQQFASEEPAEDILDVFDITASAKGEHYEIAAYESLIRLADMMEHKKVSRLLNQSLKEEQQMLKKVESFAKKVKPINMGMDEEEDEESIDMEGEEVGQGSGSNRRTAKSSRSRSRRAA